MKTFTITAWKEPVFYSNVDVQAESLEAALEMAKAHPWSDEPFEDCGDWPYPHFYRAADDEEQTEIDYSPEPEHFHAAELFNTLKEIANTPANGNSEPDVMAVALDKIVAAAAAMVAKVGGQ